MADDDRSKLRCASPAPGSKPSRRGCASSPRTSPTRSRPRRVPGGDPYTRQTISFDNALDRATGVSLVKVKDIGRDAAPFRVEQDPGNPAADEKGFVKLPNVDVLVELADLREANRSYEANLQVAKQSSDLMNQTVGLLKDV